jgi:RHS repeat-associated protein
VSNGSTTLYDYDENGNTTDNTDFEFTYGEDNRLTEVIDATVTMATYVYNGRGERVKKETAAGTTLYHYDLNGQLLAETDAAGALLREYVYLDGTPIAILEPGTGGSPDPNEQIVDDGDAGFSTTDAWTPFTNANSFQLDKQTHDPNGLSPDGVLLDDADASTEVYGGWVSGTHTGAQGGSYRYHDPTAFSAETAVLDDADAATTVVGSWNTGSSGNPINGSQRWTTSGTGTKSVTWDPELSSSREYNVYAWWTYNSNRATDATYTVNHSGGATPVEVNQTQNAAQWNLLGTFTLDSSSTVVLTDDANGTLSADAILIDPTDGAPQRVEWHPSLSGSKAYDVYARWVANANRATDAPYTIHHTAGSTTVDVNQTTGGSQWNLLGTFTLDSNSYIELTDDANGRIAADALFLDPEDGGPNLATWAFTLTESAEYEVFAWWERRASNATNAKFTVHHSSGTTQVTVDQKNNGTTWYSLGTYTLTTGAKVTLSDDADAKVTADAVRIVKTDPGGGAGGPAETLYVHTDHLGTPQLVTDDSQAVVWQADYDPFGTVSITTSTAVNNLRFPGQYFDAESGLHYNYYRDYDPETGRYIQSDPIGLIGGINLYAYVESNPIQFADRFGLVRNTRGPGICRGTDCVEPPFEPTPDGEGVGPAPQPKRGRPIPKPGAPPGFCSENSTNYVECLTCCTRGAFRLGPNWQGQCNADCGFIHARLPVVHPTGRCLI